MKPKHLTSSLLIAAGLLLGLITVCMAAYAVQSPVHILKAPAAAQERVQTLMGAICGGDYEAASVNLYGTPDLGSVPDPADPAVLLIWDTYRRSLSYTSRGEIKAADSGVSMDVTVRFLDVASVLQSLADEKTLYDAEGNLRQEAVSGALQKVLAAAMDRQDHFREQTITLDLIFEDGKWWVLPNKELTKVLSGPFW